MRRKENRKFLLLCLLMLLLCTSCASPLQNADGSPLEFFNRRVLENPEWTLEAVTELGKYRAESICSDGEHLYVLCREQNQILKLDANGEFLGFIGSVGSQPGQLYQPAAMAWDGQYLVVAEQGESAPASLHARRCVRFHPSAACERGTARVRQERCALRGGLSGLPLLSV